MHDLDINKYSGISHGTVGKESSTKQIPHKKNMLNRSRTESRTHLKSVPMRNATSCPCWILMFGFSLRWAPTSYEWRYNPYKWPKLKWVTGVKLVLLIGGPITPFIKIYNHRMGQSCNHHVEYFVEVLFLEFLDSPCVELLLLMEEILHQLIGSLSHHLQGSIHPRWCRISSINSVTVRGPFRQSSLTLTPRKSRHDVNTGGPQKSSCKDGDPK